jgi:HSP20 family molecular chaperone IbpA
MSNLDIYWKKIPTGTGGVNLNVSPLRQSVLDHHEQILNKFFDDFFGNRKQFIHSNTSYPKMDIIEDSHYFRVRCAVPGLSKEDLDVETVKETRLLTIKGKAKPSGYENDSRNHFHLKELKNSAFSRTVQFPEYVEMDPVHVLFENGLLYMAFNKIIPKEEEPTETIKKITIK